MADNFRTKTQSGLLWARWQHPDHGTPWPDITDFFGRFGLKFFTGVVEYQQILDLAPKVPNPVISTFHHLNNIIYNHASFDNPQRKSMYPAAYFSKMIYHEDPTGRQWHTPMVFHYDNATGKFYQTKGYKKLTALKLADLKTTPVLIVSDSKNVPLNDIRKAKTDQALRDFLQETSGGICQEPTFGIEFWDYGQGLVPFLHKITLNPGTGERADYGQLYHADLKNWARFENKKISVDVELEKMPAIKFYPQNRFEYHPARFDINAVRQRMGNKGLATVIAQGDPAKAALLISALIWLSSNSHGQPVGAWMSRDRRIGVIFNNDSNLVLELPPGLAK